jgi:hypothetical protein
MFIIEETKKSFKELNLLLCEYIIKNNYSIASIEREIERNEEGEEVLNLTEEEKTIAKDKIKKYLYREITDPLFFKTQRGEISKEEWMSAVTKIKQDWK